MASEYFVSPFSGAVNIRVRVPGSKSMTNRALLLAALAEGDSVLRGIGVSDDSRVFMEALTALGFDLKESYSSDGSVSVKISGCAGNLPEKKTSVYVGSAGTAARFLTAMMALSDGCYEVTSSEQMKKRPMKELLEALEALGASFDFHEESYAFPFTVTGRKHESNASKAIPVEIPLNIDRSSQFLSALLLCKSMVEKDFSIKLTGKRDAMSYVRISERMIEEFGNKGREYDVEPDVSAACYFYAMAALNAGKATVIGVNRENTQGDLRFLDVLERMGCRVSTDEDGDLVVSRDPAMRLHGVSIDMSDFSDQTMTLAAIAPFAKGMTTITGVAHIRGQESNRIEAIVNELTRLGVECEELEDGVRIIPFDEDKLEERIEEPKEVRIETYNDHRMAMAFAVAGTFLPGVIIDNPDCCRKTFDSYFDILTCLGR